ncbi:GAP family protein [Stackebrandtia nassauensis]|uniref:GAP family protein n=1 Tax=Stackebrandtia nassauensis TaxID=283811 RepID=UPI003CC761BF
MLPLAVTMMVGPQIMAATVFVMNARAIRVSAAFLAGVALATTAGVVVARGLASVLGGVVLSGGGSLSAGWVGVLVQLGLVVLLLVLALVSFLGRGDARPPRWLEALMSATPSMALRTGLMVILTMPSDIVIMLTVGVNLDHHGETVLAAVPFIVATVLVASLPLGFYLVLRDRAERVMPRVRDWLNVNSWVVNVGVCLFFAALVAF